MWKREGESDCERDFVAYSVDVCLREKESRRVWDKESARQSEGERMLTGPSFVCTLSSAVV